MSDTSTDARPPKYAPKKTEAEVIATLVAHHVRPSIETVKSPKPGEAPVLILPDGRGGLVPHAVKPLIDSWRTAPERRCGTAWSANLESFIAQVNRFRDDGSAVFADPNRGAPTLTAVIDYHEPAAGSPRFGEHRIRYAFPLSDEWKAWKAIDGQAMTQGDFAEFLEERIVDVEAPPDLVNAPVDDAAAKRLADLIARTGGHLAGPGKLMDLSRGLKLTVEEKVQNAVSLPSGEGQIQFTHEHRDEAGQPLRVPNMFLIAIPVFHDGPLYRIAVRLRYRAGGGTIRWSLLLLRPDRSFDDAFDGALAQVREQTALPIYLGGPER